MLLTVITLPINYYTQRRWHISEVQIRLYILLLLLLASYSEEGFSTIL